MSNTMRKFMNYPVGLATTRTALLGDDIPNLSQVQSIAQGLANIKEAVLTDANVNVDLATGGLLTLDGYTTQEGDRVLCHSQTDPIENGIYIASSGAWVRAVDADEQSELAPLTQVGILNGDHAGRVYKLTNSTAPIVDTDAQTWVVTSASSSAALDVAVDDGSFNAISGTNAQSVFDSVDDELVNANLNFTNLNARLNTLSGTSDDDLGSFSGAVIPDSASVKAALQALETKAEANAVIYDGNRFESAATTLATGAAVNFAHSIGTRWLSSVKAYNSATGEDITHTLIVIAVDANNVTVQNDDTDIDVVVVCAK